jgi:hypothetical protein
MMRQQPLLRTAHVAPSAVMAALFIMTSSGICLAANRLALVVQVSDYVNQEIPPLHLRGERMNDASMMKEVLSSPKYGFSVDVLDGDSATHDKIVAALDKLASSAQPDDAVVFYFSGLGANDGNQFTLCPVDALPDKADFDIKETDIVAWLARLKARNVTLILDCCFTKSGGRVLQRAWWKFIGRANTVLDKDHPLMQIDPNRAVVMSAASDKGEAFEIQQAVRNTAVGLFTRYLAWTLKNAAADATYAQAFDNLKTHFRFYYAGQDVPRDKMQTPTMYGSDRLVNRPLFSPVAVSNVSRNAKRPTTARTSAPKSPSVAIALASTHRTSRVASCIGDARL